MIRKLMICGLLAGFLAGLVGFGFMRVAGEPSIDQAIAYEEAHAPPGDDREAPVSRSAQKGIGLLTASTAYGLAFGGIFALVFAYAYGRVARTSPARTALWLVAAAFVVVYLVPFIKYPPNPPAVGQEDTIGDRTLLYLAMVWISILAAVAAVRLRRTLAVGRSLEVATGLAVAAYLAVVVAVGVTLPGVQEVPKTFPATTLWSFRTASVGTQLAMWAMIGVVFSVTAQRVMTGRSLWTLVGRRGAPATASE